MIVKLKIMIVCLTKKNLQSKDGFYVSLLNIYLSIKSPVTISILKTKIIFKNHLQCSQLIVI